MMNKYLKSLILAATIAIFITLINILQGETFSLSHTIFYLVLAFIVSFVLDLIFDKKSKTKS